MGLDKHATDLRRLMGGLESTVEEGAPEFRATANEVERLVSAMVNAPRAQIMIGRIVGKDGDVSGFIAALENALQPLVARVVQGVGGRVGGTSASAARTGLRNIAQGEV